MSLNNPEWSNGFFSFKMDLRQLVRMANWVSKFDEAANDKAVLTPSVQAIGKSMLQTFANEGLGRKWQPLSRMTQDVRTERGYNPTSPILQQSGDLRMITAEQLAGWQEYRAGGTWQDKGGGTKMVASMSARRFSAVLSGPKVDNHYGNSASIAVAASRGFASKKGQTAGFLPARPFFGIPSDMIDGIAETTADYIMQTWNEMGGRAVKRTRGKILILGNQKQTHKGAQRM